MNIFNISNPSVEELLEDIAEFEKNTSWKTAYLPAMRIQNVKGEKFLHIEDKNGFNRENIPYAYEAVFSICNRADVKGGAIHRLSSDLFARHLNDYFKVAVKKESIVNIFDGVVQATHSDAYRILSVEELVKAFVEYVTDTYPNAELKRYVITPTETIVDVALNDEKINEKYAEVLQRKMYVTNIYPMMRFITSNTGWSGANLYPVIFFNGAPLIAAEPIVLKHSGKANVDKFRTNCERSFTLMLEGAEKLEELSKIAIEYPANCAANLAKEIGLPKKRTMPILLEMQDEWGEMSANAKEVYLYLQRLLNDIENPVQQFKLSDHISRILTLDIKKFDRAKASWLDDDNAGRYVSKYQLSFDDANAA